MTSGIYELQVHSLLHRQDSIPIKVYHPTEGYPNGVESKGLEVLELTESRTLNLQYMPRLR